MMYRVQVHGTNYEYQFPTGVERVGFYKNAYVIARGERGAKLAALEQVKCDIDSRPFVKMHSGRLEVVEICRFFAPMKLVFREGFSLYNENDSQQ